MPLGEAARTTPKAENQPLWGRRPGRSGIIVISATPLRAVLPAAGRNIDDARPLGRLNPAATIGSACGGSATGRYEHNYAQAPGAHARVRGRRRDPRETVAWAVLDLMLYAVLS